MTNIDVRTQEEWNEGHIEGALHVPVEDIINEKIGPIRNLAKEEELQIYCKTGNRSGIAMSILAAMGYNNTENMGGIDRMVSLGYNEVKE